MGKPRVNLPTLARSTTTTTCIDTSNVSRNPFFTSPFPSNGPSVSPPPTTSFPICSSIHESATNSHGFNILTLRYATPNIEEKPTLPSSSLHHYYSNTVGKSSCSPHIQPKSFMSLASFNLLASSMFTSEVEPPPRPLPEGKERAQLWKKLSPSDQDDLLYGRVDFYDLKAKYDALEQVQKEEDTPIVPCEVFSECEEPAPLLIDDLPEIDQIVDQPVLTAMSPTVSDDVPQDSDFGIEIEFEPATSNFVVRSRSLGSDQLKVQHGFQDVTHFQFSPFMDDGCKPKDVKISPLYNFKKRRRK